RESAFSGCTASACRCPARCTPAGSSCLRVRASCGRRWSAESSKHPEFLDGRLNRRRSRVAEAADRRVLHRLREIVDQREFDFVRAARLACDEATKRFFLAHSADAAWDALAARLVAEEFGDAH